MKEYTALDISVPLEREEDVQGYLLVNYSVEGFEEAPGGAMIAYIEAAWSEALHHELQRAIASLGGTLTHSEPIEHKDWNAAWEASIEPVLVTSDLVVTPSWKLDEAKSFGAEHLLVIDPKMSFGTGHHETTRLCLSLISSVDCKGKRVLDVGTGTGALAMYALLLGATHVVGIDTDEWSYANAQENRSLNQMHAEDFDIRFGDLKQTVNEGERFDIVIANIHRNVLLPLAPELFVHVLPTGTLILSGLLIYDSEEVRKAYETAGFTFILQKQEHEWVALMFEKQ